MKKISIGVAIAVFSSLILWYGLPWLLPSPVAYFFR